MRPLQVTRVFALAISLGNLGAGSALAEPGAGDKAGAKADTHGQTRVGEATTSTTSTTRKETKTTRTTTRSDDSTATEADNTAINKRDRAEGALTADQQQNNKSDVELTAEIRRAVIKDKTLSTNAHNVKIIVTNGQVTLKGPVGSKAEKVSVEKKATAVAGVGKVTSEIDIAP